MQSKLRMYISLKHSWSITRHFDVDKKSLCEGTEYRPLGQVVLDLPQHSPQEERQSRTFYLVLHDEDFV